MTSYRLLLLVTIAAACAGKRGQAPIESADATVYSDFQVDKKVDLSMPTGAGPTYPQSLEKTGISGTVVAEFVVDTLGRAEMKSVRVLNRTHPEFVDAVRQALRRMQYVPAELKHQKVRQRVQQRFEFVVPN